VKEAWGRFLTKWIAKLLGSLQVKRKERKIQLCETLSFGDRRFIALVMVEGQKFLVGGAGNSISLLTSLPQAVADVAAQDFTRGIKIFK